MSADVPSKELLEQAGALARWLLETEHWQPYLRTVEIEQCSHPDRKQRVKPVINAMNVETTGKVAFLLRCRGPCNTFLEPTALEVLPGEVLTLYHNEGSSPTMDGELLEVGKQLHITQPACVKVALGDTLLLSAIFRKC